jgi:hypothetical protein
METATTLLLAANFLIPAIATYITSVRDGMEVDHVVIFTFGYWFYWILPIVVGAYQLLSYNVAMKVFYDIFDQVPTANLHSYLAISLACYLFFIFGSTMSRGLRFRTLEKVTNIRFDRRLLLLYLLLGISLYSVYAFLLRDQLFRGYTINNDQFLDPLRGTFAAWCNFIECVAFIYTVDFEFGLGGAATFRRVFFNKFMMIALLAVLLDLSIGQRNFILAFSAMLVLYRSVFFERLHLGSALVLFAVGIVAAGAVALVRSKINFTLIEILCAEPVYTSLALIYYLREARFSAVGFPSLLFGDLLFMVPTALMPNKFELIPSVSDAGIPLFNPLGTVHSFLSFMANFGVMGSMGVFFLLGFSLNLLKGCSRVPLLRVIYIMLSAQLAFSFWRDDFSYSLKGMLEFSILIPVFISVSSNTVDRFLRRRQPQRRPETVMG